MYVLFLLSCLQYFLPSSYTVFVYFVIILHFTLFSFLLIFPLIRYFIFLLFHRSLIPVTSLLLSTSPFPSHLNFLSLSSFTALSLFISPSVSLFHVYFSLFTCPLLHSPSYAHAVLFNRIYYLYTNDRLCVSCLGYTQ